MNATIDSFSDEDKRAGNSFKKDSAAHSPIAVVAETMPEVRAGARERGRLLTLDVIKGGAAQMICWHHFCVFGPMSDAAWDFAPFLFKWLANHGRISVQCFLVMAGFMAAAALLPGGSKAWIAPRFSQLPKIVFGRYKRLAKVYFIGLLAALVCAAVARALMEEPSTPAAPSISDVIAHLFFAQDLLGVPALTAGAWYVAIDLQLYALLALLCAFAASISSFVRGGRLVKFVALALVVALAMCSLFVFNRHSELEIWGIYFFGSYGLGIAAYWVSRCAGRRKALWALVMLLVGATALIVQWRSRIAVSTVTALVLVLFGTWRSQSNGWTVRLVSYLSRISFPLFVLHYPVFMLVGAVVTANWGDDPVANLMGLLVAWAVSMAAATVVSTLLDPVKKPAAEKGVGEFSHWPHTTGLAQV